MRHLFKKKVLYCGFIVLVLFILLHPNFNGRRTYEYIEKDLILDALHVETAVNFTSSAISECDYQDLVYDDTTLSINSVDGDLSEGQTVWEGGEYAPPDCIPKYSTAIIVPYRDGVEQLRAFLLHMHTFLHYQHIHYRIYVVEQVDSRPFNKAKLMNIGAKAAMCAGFPCLVLHDFNLLPLRVTNLYACTLCPRHMSSSINKYRFVLPYLKDINGAVAIISKQFKAINGLSNDYKDGDGDLHSRLDDNNLKVCRFEPETSQYFMFSQHSQSRGKQRQFGKKSNVEDGLNSLRYTEVATVLHPLFTHIMVDL